MNKIPGTERIDPTSGENIADYVTPDGQTVPMKDSDYAKLQSMAAPQAPKTEAQELFAKNFTPKPETPPIAPAQSASLAPPTPEETAALKAKLAPAAPAAPAASVAPTAPVSPIPAPSPLAVSVTEPVNVGMGFREPAELRKLAQLQIKQGELQAQQEEIKRDSLVKENEILAQQYEERMLAKAAEEQRRKALEERMDSAIRKYETMEIDTGRLWGSKSTGEKVMSAIALALGAYAQAGGATKDNPALTILQQQIDQDIRIQEANMNRAGTVAEKYRGMYSDLLSEFKDADLARAATHKFALDKMTKYYESLAATHSAPLVKNAAAQLAQTSAQKAAAIEDTLMLKKLELAGKQAKMLPGEEEYEKKSIDDILAWEKSRPGALARVGELKQVLTELDKAAEKGQLDWTSGRFAGSIPDFFRSRKAIELQMKVAKVTMQKLKDTLGSQFTNKENEMLQALDYNPKLDPVQNAQTLRTILQEMEDINRIRDAKYQFFKENRRTMGFTPPAAVQSKSYGK